MKQLDRLGMFGKFLNQLLVRLLQSLSQPQLLPRRAGRDCDSAYSQTMAASISGCLGWSASSTEEPETAGKGNAPKLAADKAPSQIQPVLLVMRL